MARLLQESADGGPSMRIMSREEWGALDPRESDPPMGTVETPISHVCFTHTDTDPCQTDEECLNIVKTIQTEQMDVVGLPDIIFSFLVGGNGVVYEGRGWHTEPHRPYLYQYLKGRGIEIAYIGNYEELPPPPEMLRVAFDFVLNGIKTKLIMPSFQCIHLA